MTGTRPLLCSYFGGKVNLMASAGFENWTNTVLDDPWLYKGKLSLITDLVQDDFAKEQLILATRAHMDKAYMQV